MKNKIILSVILLFTVNLFPQTDTALTFNEVMFKPSASNSEFIELFNTSITETIDLNNFKFKYHTSSTDIIISTGNGTLLPPKSYAVIFEGDYDFTNGIYSGLIPASALVLKLNNKAFGSSGMSNSSNRQIILFNSAGDTLDVYTYSANNSTGISAFPTLNVTTPKATDIKKAGLAKSPVIAPTLSPPAKATVPLNPPNLLTAL
ncbi:MAG: lamin tail domain-containing protein [Bacteroidetes bacterium]|nr:lamin tail domain-containing protein [Bacteroidota bacterium]